VSDTDILVVGAGPAAMVAALESASHEFSVTLVAPTGTFTESDARTTALMMPAIGTLDRFGVWETLKPKSAPLKAMRIIDATGRLVRAPTVTFEAGEIGEEAFGYNIANHDLNAALSRTIEDSDRITRIDAMASAAAFFDEKATVTLSDGDIMDARLVVAADGVNSVIRKSAGIGARTWSYPQTAIVLTFAHTREHGHISTEFHTGTGPFTVVPMTGSRSSLVWVVEPGEAERIAALDPDDLAMKIERRMESMLGRISDVTKPQSWPLSGMIAHRFGAKRLMLAGHAAHAFPPIGAQGLNLGMRDVADLGRCLAATGSDPGPAAATNRYDRLRRADVTSRTGAVDLLNRSLLTGFLPVQCARAVGMGVLSSVPPLRSLFMREGMQPGSGFRSLFDRDTWVREKDPA
jgi:2-octaprenyl-6-methoxyphenol hydroxylase